VISADLRRALAARGSAADPELRPRDEIIVFNLSASRERIWSRSSAISSCRQPRTSPSKS
jgi:hypothetical protein